MPSFSKASRSTARQALEARPGRLDVISIETRRGVQPRVTRCEAYPLDGGLAAALKRLRLGGKLAGSCAMLLPPADYQFLTIEAPALPEAAPRDEVREAARWKIKDMVDFPVAAASVDTLLVPPQQGRAAQMFAVAASHALVKPCIESFAEAKLDLAAISVPEVAQCNLARLFETPDRALALLSFGATGGLLTLTCNGELYATRRIDTSAADLARDKDLYERVVLDVQRSLDNFDRNFSHLSLQRLLVLPVPAADDFVAHLKDNLYQPVEALNISDGLDISACPMLANAATLADAWLLLGTALETATGSYSFNLFDPALQPQFDPWTSRNLGLGLAASVLLFLVWGGWAHWQESRVAQALLDTEAPLRDARNEVKQLSQQIAGYTPDVDLQRELEEGRLRLHSRTEVLALLKKGLTSETGTPAAWLRGFARQIPSGLWLTGFSVNPDTDMLEIHGRTTDPKLIAEYVRRLNSEDTFKGRTFAALDIKLPDEAPASGAPGTRPPAAGANTPAPLAATAAAPLQAADGKTPAAPQLRYHEFALSSTATPGGRS